MALIVRTYLCDDCETQFDSVEERNATPPPCPGCEAIARKIPSGGNRLTTKSQAVDIAQDVIEKDFGFTNMRDRLREGDMAAPPVDPKLQPHVQNFFNAPGEIIASAKAGAAAAAAEGRNPLSLVQGRRKQTGSDKVQFTPMARA